MFRLIRLVFTALLSFSRSIASRVNAPDHIKCMSLNDEQCMIQPTLINLHPNEYIERSCYYPFPVNLDRCIGSCNTLNGLSYKVCVQNKTEHLNLNVFIMITEIWVKNINKTSCERKCNFDRRKFNSNQKWNSNKFQCECKNPKENNWCKNTIFWILAHVFVRKAWIFSKFYWRFSNYVRRVVNAADSVSTNVTNITITKLSNITSTVSMNSDDKIDWKLRCKIDWTLRCKIDCYILHSFICDHEKSYKKDHTKIHSLPLWKTLTLQNVIILIKSH